MISAVGVKQSDDGPKRLRPARIGRKVAFVGQHAIGDDEIAGAEMRRQAAGYAETDEES